MSDKKDFYLSSSTIEKTTSLKLLDTKQVFHNFPVYRKYHY